LGVGVGGSGVSVAVGVTVAVGEGPMVAVLVLVTVGVRVIVGVAVAEGVPARIVSTFAICSLSLTDESSQPERIRARTRGSITRAVEIL
jgi:hypothetical protein